MLRRGWPLPQPADGAFPTPSPVEGQGTQLLRPLECPQPGEHGFRLGGGNAFRPRDLVAIAFHQDGAVRSRSDKLVGAGALAGGEVGIFVGQNGVVVAEEFLRLLGPAQRVRATSV